MKKAKQKKEPNYRGASWIYPSGWEIGKRTGLYWRNATGKTYLKDSGCQEKWEGK